MHLLYTSEPQFSYKANDEYINQIDTPLDTHTHTQKKKFPKTNPPDIEHSASIHVAVFVFIIIWKFSLVLYKQRAADDSRLCCQKKRRKRSTKTKEIKK